MSRETTERVTWKCPECERTYRIPRSRSRPARCANCEGKKKRVDEDSDIEFAAVPSEPAPRATHDLRETPVAAGAAIVSQSASTDPASASATPTREQFDQMIEHLDSINRTMKLFRRFLWAIGIVALLNVLLVGASLLYGMSMLGSLFSGVSESTDAGGDGIGQNLNLNDQRALNALPPEAQKIIEDYSTQLNEALRDAQ